MAATEINDLLGRSSEEDALWERLKAEGFDAERQLIVREGRTRFRVDFLIYNPRGKLAVFMGEMPPLKTNRAFRTLALNGNLDFDHALDEIRNQIKELSGPYLNKKEKMIDSRH